MTTTTNLQYWLDTKEALEASRSEKGMDHPDSLRLEALEELSMPYRIANPSGPSPLLDGRGKDQAEAFAQAYIFSVLGVTA